MTPQLLKVGTLNIQKRNRLPTKARRIEVAVAAHSWDILFLQECLLSHGGSIIGFESLRAEFGYEASCVSREFSNGIWMGNCILSKHPLHHVKSLNFSHARGMSQRSALAAKLDIGERRYLLLSLHLGLMETERTLQISQILDYCHSSADDFDGLVIGGDFNDWSGRCHKRISLWSHNHKNWPALCQPEEVSMASLLPTYPAAFPIFALDRIYAWGGCSIQDTRSLGRPLISDHRALVSDVLFA